MFHRTFSKSLPFLSLGLVLMIAAFAFHSTAVRAENNLGQFAANIQTWLRSETSVSAAPMSDFAGIYAMIDKVILEPSDAAPERIQIWGAFAMSHPEDRNAYMPPERGYFYYSLVSGKESVCRAEWADFKALAGTGQVIGFGARDNPKGRLRKAAEKAASPNPYPVAWGLTKMSQRPNNYEPVMALRSLPAPLAPADGGEVKAGKITLTAKNAYTSGANLKYVFEIRALGSGENETSAPLAAGAKDTSWSPNLQIKAGEKYIWRVKTTDGQRNGATASSEFLGIK